MLIRELVTRFGFDVDNAALGKLDANINQITVALGIAGAAMAALPVLFVRARKESEMALGALTSVGVKDLDALEKRATDFSNNYAGITKAAFLDAAYVAKGALSTLSDDAVGEYTALAALTAKATKANVEEMTRLFTSSHSNFKTLFKEMGDIEFAKELTAQISKAVNIFDSDGNKMINSMKDIAGTATSAGVAMSEQFAVLGMLQANDPTGALSGTQYRNFIQNLGKAGVSLFGKGKDSNKFIDPLTGRLRGIVAVLDIIKKKFPDLSQAAAKMELEKAFGSPEAVKVIDALITKMPQLEDNINAIATASKNGTQEAEAMANAMNRGMGFDLLQQRLHNLAEAMGKPIQEDADALAGKVGGLTLWLQELAETSPNAAKALSYLSLGFGGVAISIGTVLQFLAALSLALPLIRTALAAIGVASFAAFGWWIVLIAAVAAALAVLGQDIYAWVTGQSSALGDLLGSWSDFKDKVIAITTIAVAFIMDEWSKLTAFFQGLWDGIEGIVSRAVDSIASKIPFGDAIKGALTQKYNLAGALADAASSVAGAAAPYVIPGAGMAPATTNTINAPVTVNMTVPQGTPAEQAGAIQTTAKTSFDTMIQMIRDANSDMAGASR